MKPTTSSRYRAMGIHRRLIAEHRRRMAEVYGGK